MSKPKPLNIDWSKIINDLDVEFPEEGDNPPDIEMYPPQEIDNSQVIGDLTRLSLDIFIFDNDDIPQAYMFQNENMRIYQDISLKDSLALAKRAKKKKS